MNRPSRVHRRNLATRHAAVFARLRRVSQRARANPEHVFRELSELIDLPLLRLAWDRSVQGHPSGRQRGGDRDDREARIADLLRRFRSGEYVVPAYREVSIPKSDGGARVLRLPPFEDKVLQRAVAYLLRAVYEEDFRDSSFGYRPRRSARGALGHLRRELEPMLPCLVLDLDIRACFDRLDHSRIEQFLDLRIGDSGIRRSIRDWVAVGGAEGPRLGVPQGAVISPLLANLYLHEVLDRWFEGLVVPRLWGRTLLVRYADDAVILFSNEIVARQQRLLLPKRFATFGLTLHPRKTRLVRFGESPARVRGSGRPPLSSFDYLGFTHYWSRRSDGALVVRRKVAHVRFWRFVRSARDWCREHRGRPVWWQHRELARKLEGFFSYYGITDDRAQLQRLRDLVTRAWHRELLARERRSRGKLRRFLASHPLPGPRRGAAPPGRGPRSRSTGARSTIR